MRKIDSSRGILMIHAWHDITPGENIPNEFNAVIEIPFGSSVKYELDKSSGTDQAGSDFVFGCVLSGELRIYSADSGRR